MGWIPPMQPVQEVKTPVNGVPILGSPWPDMPRGRLVFTHGTHNSGGSYTAHFRYVSQEPPAYKRLACRLPLPGEE